MRRDMEGLEIQEFPPPANVDGEAPVAGHAPSTAPPSPTQTASTPQPTRAPSSAPTKAPPPPPQTAGPVQPAAAPLAVEHADRAAAPTADSVEHADRAAAADRAARNPGGLVQAEQARQAGWPEPRAAGHARLEAALVLRGSSGSLTGGCTYAGRPARRRAQRGHRGPSASMPGATRGGPRCAWSWR